ncbi:hypothetical protein D3C72_1996360 [compost metagenome]
MGPWRQQRVRICHRDRQANLRHHRPVDQVIADIGDLIRRQRQCIQQFAEGQKLIGLPLIKVRDAERFSPVFQ